MSTKNEVLVRVRDRRWYSADCESEESSVLAAERGRSNMRENGRRNKHRAYFRFALPPSRLGVQHGTLSEYSKARKSSPARTKGFSLVVVTESSKQRILLGMKHRGFGKGMYNSFGGKIEPGENDVESACRELEEETAIIVPLDRMANSKIGTMHFTFEDNCVEMLVHVFRIDVTCDTDEKVKTDSAALFLDPSTVRGCDEITPSWFDSYSEIPLHNMFADDSVWLTLLLSSDENTTVNGWFHFKTGGQETNTILHHCVEVGLKNGSSPKPSSPKISLEKRLFHALHDRDIQSPSIKEFNEAYAFVNTVRSFFLNDTIDVVIDVAGGHGALAALFLVTSAATSAVVIDPANVGNDGVQRAWRKFFPDKHLIYRHECLRTGLPAELCAALKETSHDRILVVACHACQHLSDEIVAISCRNGVHVAVMPCCQKDLSPGSAWKSTSKNIQVPIEKTMDILLAGKAMSWVLSGRGDVRYDVRMRVIDEKITPQNRIILCRSLRDTANDEKVKRAHERLERAYRRAHNHPANTRSIQKFDRALSATSGVVLLTGFALGFGVASLLRNRD